MDEQDTTTPKITRPELSRRGSLTADEINTVFRVVKAHVSGGAQGLMLVTLGSLLAFPAHGSTGVKMPGSYTAGGGKESVVPSAPYTRSGSRRQLLPVAVCHIANSRSTFEC